MVKAVLTIDDMPQEEVRGLGVVFVKPEFTMLT